jgi:hypothetical protein
MHPHETSSLDDHCHHGQGIHPHFTVATNKTIVMPPALTNEGNHIEGFA